MSTIFDVAKYILQKHGPMSAMKLQKLCYYSQAWSLVWEEEPVFEEDFQAWANGPVSPSLYVIHRGSFEVGESLFPNANPEAIREEHRDTIDQVLKFYGNKTAQWLSDLTHDEAPWKDTRGDLPAMARSNEVISKAAIHEYYSGL